MRLAGVGDNVVDRYRHLGPMFPGGQAVNVAVFARRCGVDAAYVGAVGDDLAGRHVLAALHSEGVETERVRVVAGSNAFAEIEVVDGDRVFVGSDEGVSRFALDADDFAYLARFDVSHTSQSSVLESQVADLARCAPVSFDFSDDHDTDYIRALAPHVTYAEISLSHLDDAAVEDWLITIQQLGPRYVLATRGAAGAFLFDGRTFHHQPAAPAQVIDTLGAGDAFTARFLVGALRRETPDVSLSDAAALASAACAAYGAFGHGTAAFPPFVPSSRTRIAASGQSATGG